MASNRKKVQQPIYNDPGWGDSISVSKKAREELAEVANVAPAEPQNTQKLQAVTQKKTAKLKEYNNYGPAKGTSRLVNKPQASNEKEEINSQMEQINREIGRAVSEIENILERFINQLGSALSNFWMALYNLLLKIFLMIVVEPIKNASKYTAAFLNMVNDSLNDFNNWVGNPGNNSRQNTFTAPRDTYDPRVKTESVPAPANTYSKPSKAAEETYEDILRRKYPHVFDGIVFSELSKKGIIFLNIKNVPIYDDTPREYTVEEEQEMLETAVREINNCARLAKSLPSPTKGKYVNRSMVEILERAGMEDLKLFLQYVYTHPKPFIERRLRLSEAFATWAHKGAPV